MDIENPVALHFIMQDELFFLKQDREAYVNAGEGTVTAAEVAVAERTETVSEARIAVTEPTLKIASIDFTYKGKKSELLILVHYPELEFIHEAHLTALENILKRKGLAVDDVAILNTAKHEETDFEIISNHFNPQKILFLGEKALPAGLAPLKLNTPQQLGKATVLYSFSFGDMMDSPENKKAFWEQMKGF